MPRTTERVVKSTQSQLVTGGMCIPYLRDLAKDYALPKPSLGMRWQRTAECR